MRNHIERGPVAYEAKQEHCPATREMVALAELYMAAPDAWRREVCNLLDKWAGEAARRQRILVHGPRTNEDPTDGRKSMDDLLRKAERYGMRDALEGELDYLRLRTLMRAVHTRHP